jgi:hypothetical protein
MAVQPIPSKPLAAVGMEDRLESLSHRGADSLPSLYIDQPLW